MAPQPSTAERRYDGAAQTKSIDVKDVAKTLREYVDVKDAAKILRVSASFLNKLRMTGAGPPFVKFGAAVRYPIPALMAWAEARMRKSTSDSGAAG
jgi:Helix-turn-helix domain